MKLRIVGGGPAGLFFADDYLRRSGRVSHAAPVRAPRT
jgi:2-polyprenyl-6-methoxyphenol hydroxylase-like FAD-dependent oxidoreductase